MVKGGEEEARRGGGSGGGGFARGRVQRIVRSIKESQPDPKVLHNMIVEGAVHPRVDPHKSSVWVAVQVGVGGVVFFAGADMLGKGLRERNRQVQEVQSQSQEHQEQQQQQQQKGEGEEHG
eukprot:EC693235.1.p3 GENE.EC693235.1~~EC693235.1.p3  ORF type:complete len:121 (-),score=27.90 EC693235.1:293-655(-)